MVINLGAMKPMNQSNLLMSFNENSVVSVTPGTCSDKTTENHSQEGETVDNIQGPKDGKTKLVARNWKPLIRQKSKKSKGSERSRYILRIFTKLSEKRMAATNGERNDFTSRKFYLGSEKISKC